MIRECIIVDVSDYFPAINEELVDDLLAVYREHGDVHIRFHAFFEPITR